MKLFLPLFLVGLLTLQSCSGGKTSSTKADTSQPVTDAIQVPGLVISKFNSFFPSVTQVDWEMEDGNYEANFQENKNEKSVLFSPQGELISSETEVNTHSLPEAMNAYLDEKLKGKKIGTAVMVVTPGGSITYEIEVDEKDYIFDGAGKFLKIEEEEGDDKD